MMRARIFLLFIITAAIVGSWYLHRAAGLGLPLPWADECAFVFPAINLADQNTLFTPQLNPERHLMWMPPGYSFVLAAVFKLLPYSLTLARDISWFFVVLMFWGLLYMLKQAAPQWIVVGLASVFLLATDFVVAGNTARMDALLLCCVCWGWCFVLRGNTYYGIALLLISPLIHPNGLYYLTGALLYVVVVKRKTRRLPSLAEVLPIAMAVLLIGAYIVYVLQHQAEFAEDMRYQIVRKTSRDIMTRLRNDSTMVTLSVGYLLAFAACIKFSPYRIMMLAIGAISLLIQIVGLEMWYSIYVAVAALILLVVIMGLASDAIDQINARTILQRGMTGVVLLTLLLWAYSRGFIPSPKRYPDAMSWNGMTMDADGEYLTTEERMNLVQRLNTLATLRPGTRVAFDPEGDALAVWSKNDCSFVPYYPKFTTTEPDVVVVHVTTFLPNWCKKHTEETMARWKIAETYLFLRSKDGDRWYVKQVRKE